MESRYLVVSTSEAVATVTIDRPDKGNSLSPDVLAEIEGTLTELGADTDVHIIVLTGGEKMFGSDDNKERIEALLETLKKRGK